ncbi:MAG: hypothetical protein KF703_13145 [Actinobacteria bacterium]|nr:hypothetical protein [Actinomycetota bacterium]
MAPVADPPDEDRVRDALATLLDEAPFANAASQRRFLRYVVDEELAGRGAALKEWSIARIALGESTSFDPRVASRIRVLAGRVRTSLARYYDGPGAGDPVRIDVPKGGYVPTFAWAEFGPAASGGGSPVGPTVAVVAFLDLTPGEHPDYLAYGFSESLVAALARHGIGPVVGPLVDSEPGPGTDRPVAQALAVDADLLLTGCVRTAGGVTRWDVRLTDVASASIRWSGTFEDRLASGAPFDAEDRIVEQLGALLADPLGVILRVGPRVPRTTDRDVYRAMLAYYDYGRSLDVSREEEVIDGLERAHRKDPGNPIVASMLAATLMFKGVGELGGRPLSEEDLRRAVDLARAADRAVPPNPLAQLVLAFDRLLAGDADDARRRMRNLLASESLSPTFRSMCGIGLLLSGDWRDGVDQLCEALALNPDHPRWQHGFLSLDALALGRPDIALEEARLVDAPGLVWGPLLRAAALGASDRIEEARAELGRVDGDALLAALGAEGFGAHTRLPPDVVVAVLRALEPVVGS